MSSTRNAGVAKGDEKHENHGAANPAPEAGMSRDVINVGMNIFKDGIKDYTEKEQELLEWLWGYAFDVLAGSRSALCKETGYDWTVLWKVFTGSYGASLDRLCEKIEFMKKKAARTGSNLVETIITQKIAEALDYARDCPESIVTITGPTGRSKTFTAQHWARNNNHGRAKYLRIPSGCTRRTLVQQLCRTCGIGVNGKKTADLESRLFKAFDFKNTIIVDEAGFLLPTCGRGVSSIEFLRDLVDMCHCSVALIFTDVYLDEFRNGRIARYFEQYLGRMEYNVKIPDDVTKKEVEAVVQSFRENPPVNLLSFAYKLANARDGKLRTLFKDLQRAKDWAEKQNHKLSYEDLKLASDWRLSGGVWPED